MTAQETLLVRVIQKQAEAEGITSFELARADGAPLPPFSAGSHIDVHLPASAGGLVRQYSLCNASHEQHRYRIAVLRDAASRGGSTVTAAVSRPTGSSPACSICASAPITSARISEKRFIASIRKIVRG